MLELYVHIPFCVKKCAYCDFLSGPSDAAARERYVRALINEIILQAKKLSADNKKRELSTIFIGGGTPSILLGGQIEAIMEAIGDTFRILPDAEITIEANPGTMTPEKLESYKKAGINRISFGLQSADNDELRLLGRIHTYEEFLESYRLARVYGFDNINIDLISAIPRQTRKSYQTSLEKVLALSPEHISAYSLIIEEGTPFAESYGEDTPFEDELPSEEDERWMYDYTKERLEKEGYHRYEISNYAKEGKECRHNLGYWEREEYLGVGIGAASLLGNVRYKNIEDLDMYMQVLHAKTDEALAKIQTVEQELTVRDRMEEFFFLGLRKMEGVSKETFRKCFSKDVEKVYGENIKELCKQKLLIEDEDRIYLTKQGIDISNYVFGKLLEF